MTKSSLWKVLGTAAQWLGASAAFAVILIMSATIVPTPAAWASHTPASGVLPLEAALVANAAVNALILVWAARRSSRRGIALWLQLLAVLFGVQWLQTQIESGYFISAFPLLQGNFEVYRLMLRGFIASALFTLVVTALVGGFARTERAQSRFVVTAGGSVKPGAWLAAVYVALYILFGYFVAWQVAELRTFYGGPAELNGFFQQWGLTLMAKPELPAFQYFRGWLWLVCLIPLFKGFTGGRRELVVLSFLALGLLPTIALLFPNPLMPAGVSQAHFWEVTISTGIYGALCAYFVPEDPQAS